MAPLKSLGPNRFASCCYQYHWNTIDKEVSDAVLDIIHGKSMQSPINSTFIALIFKKDNPEMISNFRPISLCNVLYKIGSKVIFNRLKNIMRLIIYRMQSAFIPDK